MPSIKELQEKRSGLLVKAKELMSGDNVTSENRTSAQAMFADAQTIASDIQMREQLDVETRSYSNGSVPRGGTIDELAGANTDTRSLDERKAATNKALRNYITTGAIETRDLTVGADGIMIPVGVADPVIAQKSYGSIYDVVRKLRTATGQSLKIPFINDTANGFVLESASITTTDPAVSGVTVGIDDLRSNPILLDKSLVTDTAFDLVSYVQQAIQTRYLRSSASFITNGNGSNVQGLTSITAGVTGNTAGIIKYADMTALLGSLDPAYYMNAVWAMSNTTLTQIMNIVDSNSRPIFLPWQQGTNDGFPGTIFGIPVKINQFLPTVATGAVPIQLGDFTQGYVYREVDPGVQILTLKERYAELNRLGVVAFARVGGAVTQAGSSTDAAIVSLTGR